MRFEPITTERLVIRPFLAADGDAYHERRNDPQVAEHQNWTVPVDRADSDARVAATIAMDGPVNDEWWMATVADRHTDEPYGDLAVHMTWDDRCAEIGYTFGRSFWGNGYAVESVQALVDHLFDDRGVTRVHATVHPDNTPSAMVLERTGFVWEGHTRNSYWVGDENSDDWIYGQTPHDHSDWRSRPRTPPDHMAWVPVDQSNESAVFRLKTHHTQRTFVAPMEWSYADALFPEIYNGHPMIPWMRAVHADDTLVAFVMVGLPTPGMPAPYLWRLLVDRLHQRRGIGRRVLDMVVAECRSRGASSLKTSWAPGRGTPEPFYLGYGFEPTGEIEDDEIVAVLSL